MKKIELTIIIIAVIGLILNFLHFPGGVTLTVFSLGLLACFYMYFSFMIFNDIKLKEVFKKETYKEIEAKRIIGAIIVGFVISIGIIGILFKLMIWPGAKIQLTFGLICLGITGILCLIKLRNRFYSKILKRVLVLGVIGLFLFIIPPRILLQWKYPYHPDYINAILDYNENPDNQEKYEKLIEERNKMDDIIINKKQNK